MEGINYIWIEEAAAVGHDAAVSQREFMQLNITCRAKTPGVTNRIFVTFNPVDPIGNEWLKNRVEAADAAGDSQQLRLCHRDNPFLAQAEHDQIEALADQDAEYDKIYRLGQWAMPTALIYDNWDIVQEPPDKYEERLWGLDFGYSINPAALVEVRFITRKEVYLREHLYKTSLTNLELIERLKEIVPGGEKIVGDSAEPKSLQELRNAGLNVFGSLKGADSVAHGIRTVQGLDVHVQAGSEHLIKEMRGYKWRVDINAEVVQPPKPVKILDHLLDAVRYAITQVLGLTKAGLRFPEADELTLEEAEDEQWDEI